MFVCVCAYMGVLESFNLWMPVYVSMFKCLRDSVCVCVCECTCMPACVRVCVCVKKCVCVCVHTCERRRGREWKRKNVLTYRQLFTITWRLHRNLSRRRKSLFFQRFVPPTNFHSKTFLSFISNRNVRFFFSRSKKTTFSNVILFLLLNPRQKLRSGNSKKHFLMVYFVGGGGGPCQRINMRSYFIWSMTDTRTTRLKPNH